VVFMMDSDKVDLDQMRDEYSFLGLILSSIITNNTVIFAIE